MPAENKSEAQAAAHPTPRGVAGWLEENNGFLRVIFSIGLYAGAILLLISVLLVGFGNARTRIVAGVLVASVAGLLAIRGRGGLGRGK